MSGNFSIVSTRNNLQLARKAASVATSFPAVAATATKPSGDGVIGADFTKALIYFFGTDTANETFNARVIRWEPLPGTNVAYPPGIPAVDENIWVPVVLWTGVVTLGAMTGVADSHIPVANLFADTIASTGTPAAVVTLYSPADDTVAYLKVEHDGAPLLEIQFDLVSAAGAGAVVRFV